MNSQELVSVYMPTHNRPDMALRAIQSVLSQSYNNIELIVCDDGSDYDAYERVRDVLKENCATYLRLDSPAGACTARNLAIRAAKGTFVTGLDDDDEMLPDHVQGLMDAYDESFAFVCAGYYRVEKIKRSRQICPSGVLTLDRLLHSNCVGNQVLTETKRLSDVGGFDSDMPAMQDYDLWIRLMLEFGNGLKINQCSYLQHVEHDEKRISRDREKLLTAFTRLRGKYQALYTRKHAGSHELIEIKSRGDKLTLAKCIQLINRYNFRFAVSLYLKQLWNRRLRT